MYPSWCCQRCCAEIGYIGRFIDFLTRGPIFHKCTPPERLLVDREGVIYPPVTPVKLKARQ